MALFFGYSYIRIVQPYLDVGQIVKPAPETPYFRQSIVIEGERYSYWTNGVKNPKKILVMLPPSSATGDFFAKYAEVLPKNVLIIAPDYPARGLTSRIKESDTEDRIAERIGILIKKLIGKKEFEIVGPSLGGMIATKLVEDKDFKISKIFLIATGEFFANDQKNLFHLAVYPAIVSEKIRRSYVSFFRNNNYFDNLEDGNSEDLMEQWIATLEYKIDVTQKVSTPTVIVIFDKDNIIQKNSEQKLETKFFNHKIFHLDLTHQTPNFFDSNLINVVASNL